MQQVCNGFDRPDSKDSNSKVSMSANFSDCPRDPPGSNFHNFISFLRVVLLFSKTGYTLRYTEGYRSGHNGADSKSVWGQPHVGSNPTPSASVVASCISLATTFLCFTSKKPSLAHSAAPPFPTKPCGLAGCPVHPVAMRVAGVPFSFILRYSALILGCSFHRIWKERFASSHTIQGFAPR